MSRKYFNEEEINKVLECRRCQKRYDQALMMPCGKSVCKQCVKEVLGDDYESTLKPNSPFKCLMCRREHEMPKEGLPVNDQISMLLEKDQASSDKIFDNKLNQKLKTCLEKLKEKHLGLKFAFKNREQIIRDHFESIRQEIYSSVESRKDELNKACEQLINEVNEKEKFNLEQIGSSWSKKKDNIPSILKELREKYEKLRVECEKILQSKCKLTEADLTEPLGQADELNFIYDNKISMNTKLTYFDGRKLKFTRNTIALTKKDIGNLEIFKIESNIDSIDSISVKREIKSQAVNALALLTDGTLASGSENSNIKIWDVSTGRWICTLVGHYDSVVSLAALPEGKLASGSYDKEIIIWKASYGIWLHRLKEHTDCVSLLVALHDGSLVSASEDSTIKIWNPTEAKCLKTFEKNGYYSLAVLTDDTLATGLDDGKIKLWNVTKVECIRTLTGHTGCIYTLVVHPDGSLISGSDDLKIKIWNTSTGECIRTLSGSTSTIWSLAVLSDNNLVSGSENGTISIWNITTGRCLRTLGNQKRIMYGLTVLPDGTLVSGSSSIKFWNNR